LLLVAQVSPLGLTAQVIQGARFDPAPAELARFEVQRPRPVSPMDLLGLRDAKGLAVSPDGKWIAFVIGHAVYEENAYRSGLFLVATTGSSGPRSLGTAGMPHWDEINQWIAESPQWSEDNRWIWYRTRMSTRQPWQVWGWRLPSGRREQITQVDGNIERYSYLADEEALLLTVARKQTSDVPAKAGERGVLFTGQIRGYQTIPVPVQLELALQPKREYWVHDLRTGRERKATAREIHKGSVEAGSDPNAPEADAQELGKYHVVDSRVSPDGSHIAYLYVVDDPSVSPSWSRGLLLVSRRAHTVRKVKPDARVIDQLWWGSDGATLYFTERDGRGHSPALWRVSADGENPLLLFQPAVPDYVSSFSPDRTGRFVACLVENNLTPPQVAVLDTVAETLRILVDLNPRFASLERSPAERVEGTNRYGDKWFAYLVKPLNYQAGIQYPLIITTYRSGDYFLRGGSGDENPIQVYAAHGFAVLCFDAGPIRNLHAGRFEEKVQDWASPAASLEAAVHELSGRGLIDATRVGIAGFSHGEEIAGYAVAHTNLFHAAVGAAFYDPCFYFLGGAEWWDVFERWGLGGWPKGKSESNWQQIAMSANADRIAVPILENASDTEYLVYLPVYRSLASLGKPVELYLYPNELHVRNQPKHRLEIYERNLDWFLFWLQEEERPGPEKREQYRRWRQMKSSVRTAPEELPTIRP
jgi:dipeptidyl aminopeptidase/acylaminoacyl peptidase